ncbi:MAG: hypothetical protein MUC54_00430 [Chloroflexi bacterium]|jgi:hypothetical protein|nr:hypothetical protein [Chloroflexota bacterium]
MATTETRTGFRLPWAADRPSSREVEETDGSVEIEGAACEPGMDSAALAQEAPPAAPATFDTTEAPPSSADDPRDPAAPEVPTPTGPARRPTRFMTDLLKAMHAAAEAARSASLEQFQGDGQSFVDQIHTRSATQVEDLRRQSDDDVAAIKDWSKAEIARIREETEARIAARRERLDQQLERHAALIEREIEKVRARVAAYELEMQAFFDGILAEEDPTAFAARAAQLPEPPTFEQLDDQALAELLNEPVPAIEAAPEPEPELEPVTVVEADATSVADEAVPGELETAMAAIQAAAEAADEPGLPGAADEQADQAAEPVTPEPVTEAGAAPEREVDPRIAMLGLTPDFEAAEAEAAAAAAGEGFDEMGEESVSARLAGLVAPAAGDVREPASTVTSQVVVVGLVSVASIASFKRHLGRLSGVTHVGVSSGPDGEFVYAVSHDPTVVLADLVPSIPGFGARVTGAGDGIINVSAGDPEA